MFGEFADHTNSPNISLLYELWFAGRAQGPPLRYNQGFRICFAFCNAPFLCAVRERMVWREERAPAAPHPSVIRTCFPVSALTAISTARPPGTAQEKT